MSFNFNAAILPRFRAANGPENFARVFSNARILLSVTEGSLRPSFFKSTMVSPWKLCCALTFNNLLLFLHFTSWEDVCAHTLPRFIR